LSPSYEREYVAWGWAVNGFASVVASVLATIIAMTYGFRVVFAFALVCYIVALAMVHRLRPGDSSTRTDQPLSYAAEAPVDSLAPATE
jgi:predicted MFS family arabinose efflux permease